MVERGRPPSELTDDGLAVPIGASEVIPEPVAEIVATSASEPDPWLPEGGIVLGGQVFVDHPPAREEVVGRRLLGLVFVAATVLVLLGLWWAMAELSQLIEVELLGDAE